MSNSAFMATNIVQQVTSAVQSLLPKSNANLQASNAIVPSPRNIQIPRELIESHSKPESSQAESTAPEIAMTPKEISNAKLATQEFNPKFLKEIATDLQPALLNPTGNTGEQITYLTNLITAVLAGENPAIPEFKGDKVLDFSSKKPAESFLERVIDRYHAEVTSKDNYPRDLGKEELTKLVKANLEPLASLAVKLEKTNLTAQISSLLNRNLNATNGHDNSFFGFIPRDNKLTKAVNTASDDIFTQLATNNPKLLLEAMLDNNQKERSFSPEGIARTLLRVSDEGFRDILESFKSHPDSLVEALVNITAKEVNPFVGYSFEGLTKGTQARLGQILEAVKPLETKLTETAAMTEFSANKAQVIDYLTKVVNHGTNKVA